jgi:hypothetical protein
MEWLSMKRGEQSNKEASLNKIDDANNCEAVAKQTNNDYGGGGGSVVGEINTNLATIAMSALIDLSRGKGEESKSGEKTVEEIDDDGDLKPAAKSTNFILRHDKDSVNNNEEGGKGEDEEFDSFFYHNDENTDIDREGGTGAASNNDTNMAVELNFVDELTNLGNTKNKEINDGYNIADEERGGSFADISVDQQRQVDTGIDALLYAGLFDTSERKQEADDDDDDNVVGDWEPGDYLVVGGVLPKTMIRK